MTRWSSRCRGKRERRRRCRWFRPRSDNRRYIDPRGCCARRHECRGAANHLPGNPADERWRRRFARPCVARQRRFPAQCRTRYRRHRRSRRAGAAGASLLVPPGFEPRPAAPCNILRIEAALDWLTARQPLFPQAAQASALGAIGVAVAAPQAERVADHFARAGIIAGGDRLVDFGGEFLGQRDAEFADNTHGSAPRWYDLVIPLARIRLNRTLRPARPAP